MQTAHSARTVARMRSKWQQTADSGKEPSQDPLPDQQDAPDPWIGIEEAAHYLAVPIRTLYLLAQRKQVPAVKVGRAWRFKRSVLDDRLREANPSRRSRMDTFPDLGSLSDHRGRGQSGLPQPGAAAAT